MRLGRSRAGVLALVAIALAILIGDALERDRDEAPERAPDGTPGAASERAEVLRVVDGDTIEVELDGGIEDVRYIGIDTPESVKPGEPIECFGPEAAAANRALVAGREVRLVFDRELRDRFGRLLAYVYAGDEFVNAALVERGFARTLEIEPNTARAGELSRLEQGASSAGRGLWGECPVGSE